ncbi:hypothetical protein NUU61_001668 [Penicillium alfredii]|uniref:Uncharacterized protein n=1 Tax=Penicillium alfredii TaxID=1506179 RepID=A0A9W9FQ58_9EURO|nr:uncharacterized protein NUU61_001668 [Penicillium alfredii]KAJ5104321.1 hypothetical protein NUU61_001668 [Penicillium alfredii]
MKTPYRVSLTIILVVALLLVKKHLNSLRSQWPAHGQLTARDSYVVTNGGAHIELVSISNDPVDDVVVLLKTADVTSASAWTATTTATPTSEPTQPSTQSRQSPTVASPPEPLTDPIENGQSLVLTIPVPAASRAFDREEHPPRPKVTPKSDRVIILGQMSYEDTSWLEEQLPEWQHAVYVVDDFEAPLQVERNKGKESSPYLRYIIDNYHRLPHYMVFLHAHQFGSHVEFPEQDNVLTVQRLQLDYVDKAGYANLRCQWEPGCPDEVQPFRQLAGRTTELAFAGAWIRIFNNTNIPEVVGTACCAQFAVTKSQVLQRPRSDYEAYHRWLMETELDDDTSGRVFEYLWHIIFGQEVLNCPSKEQCYRDVYGIEWEDVWSGLEIELQDPEGQGPNLGDSLEDPQNLNQDPVDMNGGLDDVNENSTDVNQTSADVNQHPTDMDDLVNTHQDLYDGVLRQE